MNYQPLKPGWWVYELFVFVTLWTITGAGLHHFQVTNVYHIMFWGYIAGRFGFVIAHYVTPKKKVPTND